MAGGASGGGAGNTGVSGIDQGFGGGGGSGDLDGDAESSRAETGEDGGETLDSGAIYFAHPGVSDDFEYTDRTFTTCIGSVSGIPGQGGASLDAAGDGTDGCDGAVIIQSGDAVLNFPREMAEAGFQPGVWKSDGRPQSGGAIPQPWYRDKDYGWYQTGLSDNNTSPLTPSRLCRGGVLLWNTGEYWRSSGGIALAFGGVTP